MTPLALACVIVLCTALLFAPRRWAALVLIAGIVYLSQRNGLQLFGMRMFPGRFLELAAFIRVVSRQEFRWVDISRLDRAVVAAYAYVTIVFVIRTALGYGTSSEIKMISTPAKIAEMIDALLAYFAFRGLLRDGADIRWVLSWSIMLLIPFVGLLCVERSTGQNPLVVLGAIPKIWIDAGGGRVRCFGSFLHPSLLGTVGANFAIMYVALAVEREQRLLGTIGVLLGLAIVLLANSGGPLTMLMVGLLGWCCWLIRTQMRLLRVGMLGALVLLALVMRQPIWYLPSKMSILFGGDGWHRSYLMQQAITNMDQWWFAGMPLDLTLSWFPYSVLGAADLTNVYISFGVDGGLIAMLLLISMLVCAFSELGSAVARTRDKGFSNQSDELLFWGLGAALAGHVVNFISITYFDQSSTMWLFVLAAVSSVSQVAGRSSSDAREKVSSGSEVRRFVRPRGKRLEKGLSRDQPNVPRSRRAGTRTKRSAPNL